MPLFMHQVAYSPEGWTAIISNPQNRIEAVRSAIEKLGGKVVSGWLSSSHRPGRIGNRKPEIQAGPIRRALHCALCDELRVAHSLRLYRNGWVRPPAARVPPASRGMTRASCTREPILQGLTQRLNRSGLTKLADLLIRHDILQSHLPADCPYHLQHLGDLFFRQ